ncbi:MAG: hypothetical protein MUF71_21125 [Candidatus Kapabacteria bacterium]|nr:hypothetical protein [Candidatus Kapabacteria bacterium]
MFTFSLHAHSWDAVLGAVMMNGYKAARFCSIRNLKNGIAKKLRAFIGCELLTREKNKEWEKKVTVLRGNFSEVLGMRLKSRF